MYSRTILYLIIQIIEYFYFVFISWIEVLLLSPILITVILYILILYVILRQINKLYIENNDSKYNLFTFIDTELQTTPTFESSLIAIDNMNIHYIYYNQFNDKTNTFVFIHGIGSNSIYYIELMRAIQLEYPLNRIIAIDLPGFGLSTIDRERVENFTTQDIKIFYSNILEIFFDRLKLDNITLMGHSFGGFIALNYCHIYPSKIKNLILIDSAGFFPTLGEYGYYWGLFFKLQLPFVITRNSRFLLHWVRYINLTPKQRFWLDFLTQPDTISDTIVSKFISYKHFGLYWNDPSYIILKSLKFPIVLFYGKQDTLMPIHQGWTLMKLTNNVIRCIGVDGVGHSPFNLDGRSQFLEVLKSSSVAEYKPMDVMFPVTSVDKYYSTISFLNTKRTIRHYYSFLLKTRVF